MATFGSLIDAVLFLCFLVIAVGALLLDGQTILTIEYQPDFLVNINNWYMSEYGDYLVAEKPAFFVGLAWLEILFLWPLVIVNLYAIVASKAWFRTTCLISGVSHFTALVGVMTEMVSSGKASDKLLAIYYPFLGYGALAMLRGLYLSTISTPQPRKKNTA